MSEKKKDQNDLTALKEQTAKAHQKLIEDIYSNRPRAALEEPRLEDEEVEENPFKCLDDQKRRAFLKDHPIIVRAMEETGKSLRYLMNDLSIEPSDEDPRSWAVSHTMTLCARTPEEQGKMARTGLALQEAAWVIWFYRGRGTYQQRGWVKSLIDKAIMTPTFEHGQRLSGRRPGQRFKGNEILDRELKKILDILGPDAIFHSRATWYEGPRKKTVIKEIEKKSLDGDDFFKEVDFENETVCIMVRHREKDIPFKTIQNRLTNIKKNYR